MELEQCEEQIVIGETNYNAENIVISRAGEDGICSLRSLNEGVYLDNGDFNCKAFYNAFMGEITNIEIQNCEIKISLGDQIVFARNVYIVEQIVKDIEIKYILKVKKDDLESSLFKLQDMGIKIEKGVQVPVSQSLTPEDMHFVDQWVGIWTKNICENYQSLKQGKSIKDLQNICKDTTAVIIGAGPSLDKNIEELKDINALIIATDRAYKPLLARGIEPDLVVCVDCHDDLILGYLDKVENSKHTLVLNSASDFQITKNWQGKILYFNMGHAGIQFCDRILPYLFGNFMAVANVGCVVNTALIIASWIGCNPLILVGCDFSYPNQKMSCDTYDLIDDKLQKIEIDEVERFEKRTGKIQKNGIFTYPPFIDYEKTMKVLEKTQNLHIINATEGGIIEGFPTMKLSEAKEKFCKENVSIAKSKLKQEVN